MSADTFTWIAKFNDWYRVCFSQASDNLSYYHKGSKWEKMMCIQYFWWCELLQTKEEAIAYATKLDENLFANDNRYCNEYWNLYFEFPYTMLDIEKEFQERKDAEIINLHKRFYNQHKYMDLDWFTEEEYINS